MPVGSQMESSRPQVRHHPSPASGGVLDSSQGGLYDCHPSPSQAPIPGGGSVTPYHHFSPNCQTSSMQQQRRKGLEQSSIPYTNYSTSNNNNSYYYNNTHPPSYISHPSIPPPPPPPPPISSHISSPVAQSTQPSPSLQKTSSNQTVSRSVTSAPLPSTMKLTNSSKNAAETLSESTPSGQKLTYLMQQAMLPFNCDNDKYMGSHHPSDNNVAAFDANSLPIQQPKCIPGESQPPVSKMNSDHMPPCSKEDGHIMSTGSQESSGSQKASPTSQGATPNRDMDSPGSTEPTSLPSDGTNSHSTSDRKCTVLDLQELESSSVVPCIGDSSYQMDVLASRNSADDSSNSGGAVSLSHRTEHMDIDAGASDDNELDASMLEPDDFTPKIGETSSHALKRIDVTIEDVLDKIRMGHGEEFLFQIPDSPVKSSSHPSTPKKQPLVTSSSTPAPTDQTLYSPNPVDKESKLPRCSNPSSAPESPVFSTTNSSPKSQQNYSLSPTSNPGVPLPHQSNSTAAYMHQQQHRIPPVLNQNTSTFRHPVHPRKYNMSNTQPPYNCPPQGYPPHPSQHLLPNQISPHSNSFMQPPIHPQQPHYLPANYSPHPSPYPNPIRHPASPHHSLYVHPAAYHRMPMQSQQPQSYYSSHPPSNMPLNNNYSMAGHPPSAYVQLNQVRSQIPLGVTNSPSGKPYYPAPSLPGQPGAGYMQQLPPHPQSVSPNRISPSSCSMMPHQMSIYDQKMSPGVTPQNLPPAGYYNRTDSSGFPQVSNCAVPPNIPHNTARFFAPNSAGGDFGCPSALQQSNFMTPQSVHHSNIPPSQQPPIAGGLMAPPNINSHPPNQSSNRKRGGDKTKDVPLGKKKRQESINNLQQSLTNATFQIAYKELTTRLHVPNYCSLLQEPLVTPSLSLHPPKGGCFLGNITKGLEAEADSDFILERLKKYVLSPFHLKHNKPNDSSKLRCQDVNAYLLENMSVNVSPSVVPVVPLLTANLINCDADMPDNPVCGTPTPSEEELSNGQIPGMLGMFHQADISDNAQNRPATPSVQLLYPFLFQHEQTTMNTPSSSNLLSSNIITTKCKSESDNDRLRFKFTVNASMADTVPTVVRDFTNMLGIDFKEVDYQVSLSAQQEGLVENVANEHTSTAVINGSFASPDQLSMTDNYPEQSVSVTSLITSKKQACCKQCEMMVFDWQSITTSTCPDSIFCSVSCLTNYTKKQELFDKDTKKKNECVQVPEYSQQIYMGDQLSPVKVLLKGPLPKNSKASMKRQISHERFLHPAVLNKVPLQKFGIKRWKDITWKRYKVADMTPVRFYKDLTQDELNQLLLNQSPALNLRQQVPDNRICRLCKKAGDMCEDSTGRMLNLGVDDWLHINCALWCYNVYETVSGALVDPESTSYPRAEKTVCAHCGLNGAGLPCYRSRCTFIYHVPCAKEAGCMFFTDRGMYCPMHTLTKDHPLYMPDLSAKRRIFIDRDEHSAIGRCLQNMNNSFVLRWGSLCVHSIGHLSFHQISSGHFNTPNFIYPIGYKATRIHWSPTRVNRRCQYTCTIEVKDQYPWFILTFTEDDAVPERHEGKTCDEACRDIFKRIASLRQSANLIRFYPEHIRGEEMFGLSESPVIKILESLPASEALPNYLFRFGKIPSLIASRLPTSSLSSKQGCSRVDGSIATEIRRRRSSRYLCSRMAPPAQISFPSGTSTGRQCVTSTSSNLESKYNKAHQFRRLSAGREWEQNVYLGQSSKGGLGLFSRRELDKNSIVIELSGELVRDLVAKQREASYRASQRLDILFVRLSTEWVLDASRQSNQARYLRHSCDPNCVTETIVIDERYYVILSTLRRIEPQEELTCSFKIDSFSAREWDSEAEKQLDSIDQIRLPCQCGATSCRKWWN